MWSTARQGTVPCGHVPRIPDLIEPLSDGHATLRLAMERDIPDVLIAHQDDPTLHEKLGLRRPPSGAELGREMEHAPAARAEGRMVTFTVLEPGSEDCRGQVRAEHFDWDHARAELGIWLVPQARGQGLAPAALRLAAGWLFDACAIKRLQLLCAPGDEPLLRTARRVGFLEEGTLRGHDRTADGRADRILLSLLPPDLAGRR